MSGAREGDLPFLERLAALVARARTQARTTGRQVLVTASEAVSVVDPLAALQTAVQAAQADDELAALLRSGRVFWAHPRGALALSGMGAAVTIAPTGQERFTRADRAWRALLDGACVEGASPDTPTVGPVLMGGFAFDPEGPHSDLWRGFPSTQLVAPALHLTAAGARYWLTATTLVEPNGELSIPMDVLARLRAVVLAAPPHAPSHAPPHALGESSGPEIDGRLALAEVRPASEWRSLVRDAVAAIRRGELDKVVVARAVRALAAQELNVAALLDQLRAAHRDGYVFGYWRGDRVFVGASPERLVRLAGREVVASSLAGSARRGATPEEDAASAAELLASEKDRAEHALVRSALCDGLARLCDDVTSRDEPSLLTLPNVHHLHTAVRARLRAGHSLLELAGALHPTPAVGGEPRDAALRFIRDREPLDRGWYAGPIGWIGREAGELAVALRSALVKGREAMLFAGCGIVAGSDPDRELAESEVKLESMQSALAATLGDAADEQVDPSVLAAAAGAERSA